MKNSVILFFVFFIAQVQIFAEGDKPWGWRLLAPSIKKTDFSALATLTPVSADSCVIDVDVIYRIYEKEPGKYSEKFQINQCQVEIGPRNFYPAEHSFPVQERDIPWIKPANYKAPVFFFLKQDENSLYFENELFRELRIEGVRSVAGDPTFLVNTSYFTCDPTIIGLGGNPYNISDIKMNLKTKFVNETHKDFYVQPLGYIHDYDFNYLHHYGTPYENKNYKKAEIEKYLDDFKIDRKKLDKFLRTNRKPITVSKIKSKDYAVGTIFSMEQQDSLCKIHYNPEFAWEKNGEQIDTIPLNGLTLGRSSFYSEKNIYDSVAVKKGKCFPPDKLYRTMYFFGEKKEGVYTIDSILSTNDVWVHNDDLIDMRMGISFDDFLDALMPNGITINDYRYYVFLYMFEAQIFDVNFPEEQAQEFASGYIKVSDFCKEFRNANKKENN